MEHHDVGGDIGVFAHRVGIGVVPRVFVHPPGVADADDKIGHDATDSAIGFTLGEHLFMCHFVSEERKLCEHHGHHRREGDLPPAGSDKHHSHNGPRHKHTQHRQNSGVVAALAGEKSRFSDPGN